MMDFYFKKYPKGKSKKEFESFGRTIVREEGSLRNEKNQST
jgi:hypothetical protein